MGTDYAEKLIKAAAANIPAGWKSSQRGGMVTYTNTSTGTTFAKFCFNIGNQTKDAWIQSYAQKNNCENMGKSTAWKTELQCEVNVNNRTGVMWVEVQDERPNPQSIWGYQMTCFKDDPESCGPEFDEIFQPALDANFNCGRE
jgi:hypothetical protein